MQDYDLPSPDIGSMGLELRRVAAKSISALEIVALGYPSGKHPSATTLKAFFLSCAAALGEGEIVVPPVTPGEPVTLLPNPSNFAPVTSSSTGPIDVDTGRMTHRSAAVIKEGGNDTKLDVAKTADNAQSVYVDSGLVAGSSFVSINRRLLGNDYQYGPGMNIDIGAVLAVGDEVALVCDGNPRTIRLEVNGRVAFGPKLLSSSTDSEAVWGNDWPENATIAGARSNTAGANVTVSRIETPVSVGDVTLFISGELRVRVSYVGSPDTFRARIERSDGTVIDDYKPVTAIATTGAGDALLSYVPTVGGADAGTDVYIRVQQVKGGVPVAGATGIKMYYSRPQATPLEVGYNLGRANERVVNDWSKEIYIDNSYSPAAYRMPSEIKGSGYIQTNTGVTLTNQNNVAGFTITSNPTTGRHDYVATADRFTDQFCIGFGGGPAPTSIKVFPNGNDPESFNSGIYPKLSLAAIGAGFRDLDYDSGNADLLGLTMTPATRAKVTDKNYLNGSDYGMPIEREIALANKFFENNSKARRWGHVMTLNVDNAVVAEQAALLRDTLNPNVLTHLEFGNERNWNYTKMRLALEAAKSGLYGNGAETAYPNTKYTASGGGNGIGEGVAMNAGDTVVYNQYGIGYRLLQATKNLPAGNDVVEGPNYTVIATYQSIMDGQRRWLGKRSVEVWNIVRDVFGAQAFAARVRPTVCGQAEKTKFEDLAIELNMPGFMNIVTNIGQSAYSQDRLNHEQPGATLETIYNGFFNDLSGPHAARVGAWNDLVLREGKENYWYEWALHPNIFVGNPHNSYRQAWDQLRQDPVRVRTLERMLVQSMRQRATGPAFYYKGFNDPTWALRPGGYDDTTNPRWLGHQEGFAA